MTFRSKNIARPEDGSVLANVQSLLRKLAKAPSPRNGLPRLYRIGTISKILDIPRSTVRVLISKGHIRSYKILERVYIEHNDVIKFLREVGLEMSSGP